MVNNMIEQTIEIIAIDSITPKYDFIKSLDLRTYNNTIDNTMANTNNTMAPDK